MKNVTLVARILLGLVFFVFGLNGFLHFLPQPPMPEQAGAMMGALFATGYFFPVLKATEVVCGALLLSGYYVPLALVILAPISLQILLFHTVLAPAGALLAVAIVGMHVFLGWRHLAAYKGMLQPKFKIA